MNELKNPDKQSHALRNTVAGALIPFAMAAVAKPAVQLEQSAVNGITEFADAVAAADQAQKFEQQAKEAIDAANAKKAASEGTTMQGEGIHAVLSGNVDLQGVNVVSEATPVQAEQSPVSAADLGTVVVSNTVTLGN